MALSLLGWRSIEMKLAFSSFVRCTVKVVEYVLLCITLLCGVECRQGKKPAR
jgi:hypothetical protein